MATYVQRSSGEWNAQVFRRGIRKSATFPSRSEAEAWATNIEAAILGKTAATVIELTSREILDIYRRSVERAAARGIHYQLTRVEVEALFLASNGRCAVSGIAFSRFRPLNSTKRPWYPSLDRIDSSRAYTPDNCRFVCVAVNVAMGEWGEWVLRAVTKAIGEGKSPVHVGPEAPPYKFSSISGTPTKRQEARRRARALTHESPTDAVLPEGIRVPSSAQ